MICTNSTTSWRKRVFISSMMRLFILFVGVVLFYSCEFSAKKKDVSKIVIDVDKKSSFNSSKELSSDVSSTVKQSVLEEKDSLPEWLVDNHTFEEGDSFSFISQFQRLNDSVFYVIEELNDMGLCSDADLYLYLDTILIDTYLLRNACDHNPSSSEYSWREYEMIDLQQFEVINGKMWLDSIYLDKNGEIIDKKVFFDFEPYEKEDTSIVTILSTGKLLIE